jgi:hypothetical protein
MKKLLLLVMILSIGCSDDPEKKDIKEAYVSFENNSSLVILYGIKYGDARFTGSLSPGQYTYYYVTEPGVYPVELLTPSGWLPEKYTYETKDGRYYTIELIGSITAYQYIMWVDE